MVDLQYVAFIGDVIGSRTYHGADREILQQNIEALVRRLNARFQEERVVAIEVTEGDGIKGLLHPTPGLDDLLWIIHVEFEHIPMRLGIGAGTLETSRRSSVSTMDGSVFHEARAAVAASHETDRRGGHFRGFGAFDSVLDGIAGLLHALRTRTPDRQMQVLKMLRAGHRQSEVAAELEVSRQAVSEYTRLGQWPYYRDGENALRAALRAAYEAAS